MARSKFYVTTAIVYANAKPHIGFALEVVQADVLARYHRLIGDDTFFLTGADEHGLKIQRTAKKAGVSPKVFVSKNTAEAKKLVKILNASNNDFIRTSDQKNHWPAVYKLWQKLIDSGDIYKKKYKEFYCVGCEGFKEENELVDGKCIYHLVEPEIIEEENYFFRLSKYEKDLLDKIKKDEIKIIPDSRKREVINFIKQGLRDVSFSRLKEKLYWGIPVPKDSEQTIYVWCDALTNYISAIGYKEETKQFKKLWPADTHIIGKDILRFHAVYWPAILMSAGLPLPKKIFVHGFITSGGRKMSKSLGNVIDPFTVTKKYGTDAFRYFILRKISPTEDSDFTIKRFEEVFNSDLANDLGNLIQRVSVMINKYLGGKVPKEIDIKEISKKEAKKEFEEINKQVKDIDKLMDEFKFDQVLELIWSWVRSANQYIDKEEPWVLAKKNKKRLEQVLSNLVSVVLDIAWYLGPFMPETSKKINNIFGEEKAKVEKPLFPRIA